MGREEGRRSNKVEEKRKEGKSQEVLRWKVISKMMAMDNEGRVEGKRKKKRNE